MAKPFAIAAVLTALITGPALADPTAAAPPAVRAKAGELVKQAIAKSQAGDHDAAIDLYQQAYTLIPQPVLLSNLGSEYQQQGKKVEAVKYFCKYLADEPNGTNASYATAQAKALQIELGNTPDDKDVCKAKPKAAEPPPTPPPPLPIVKEPPPIAPPGDVTAGSALAKGPEVATPHPSRTLEYTGIAVGAVGLAAFGAGVYYGLQAKSISDSISNHDVTRMWPMDIKQQQADGASDQNMQILFMISGGVVAAAGTFMAWRGHHAAAPDHVSLRPVATPTAVGLTLDGGF